MHNKVPKNEYLNKKGYAPKKNPEKIVNDGVIYDPRGQWGFPGEVTKIPSGNITMQGVPYPVLGVDDLGNEQMMYPGFDYTFPGNTVTEYPQLQYGGDPSIPELNQAKKGGWLNKYSKMPKKKSSKNIKTSINKLMTRNPLFERNYTLYGAKGPRLYDPTSKYQTGGVTINSEEEYRKSLLMKNKSKERIDAERAWAAKKVAAANQAKTQQPSGIPSPQQQAALFGMKPVAAESTGIAAKPVYTPKEKENIQKAQYDAKREKARQIVRATYGPQGSNPKALYDEEGLINSYLGAQERQKQKEQEMKTLGSGLVLGAVAAPAALEAIGSGIAAAPSYASATGAALNAPILESVGSSALPWLTPNSALTGYGMYKGSMGLKDESVPDWQRVYENPSGTNITKALLSTTGNIISISPLLSKMTSAPLMKYIPTQPAFSILETQGISALEREGLKDLETFTAKKLASQAKSGIKSELQTAINSEEEPTYYPATPRRGLYADNPYYNAPAESTSVYPRYYAQNLIAAPESTGVNPQYNWLDNYR